MNGIDPDRKVYFKLDSLVAKCVLDRVEKFLLDGATGNVKLNIKDGQILGCHVEEIVSARGPQPRRRTA